MPLENKYPITYDIKKGYDGPELKFKQGSINSAILDVTIVENNNAVDITGEDISFRFKKADGTFVSQDSEHGVSVVSELDGEVECVLMAQTLACEGLLKCEIVRTLGNSILPCLTFDIYVLEQLEKGILSTNYVSSLETEVEEIHSKEENRQQTFNTNENTRQETFNTNENARQNEFNISESNRQTEYDSLKKSIISEDPAANLQNQLNTVNSQLAEMETQKANDADDNRTTTSKTVTGAINELNDNKASKMEVNALELKKADQAFVDSQFASIVSGAPTATYADLATLQAAYPSGTEGVFLVLADGHWYYWNSITSSWTDGGIYQATGVADGGVTPVKTSFMGVEDIVPTWITGYYMYYTTTSSIKAGANFEISRPIKLLKGETIEVAANVANTSVVVLAKVVSGNTDMTISASIASVIGMGGTNSVTVKYSAVDDIEYVAITALIANGATIKKYYNVKPSNDSEIIIPTYTTGYYVNASGKSLVANTNYKYADIELECGETIYISTYETNSDIGILSKIIDGKISSIIGTLTAYGIIQYTATETSEIIRICCRVANGANVYKKVIADNTRKKLISFMAQEAEMKNDDDLKHLVKNVLCIGDSLTKGAYYSDATGHSGTAIAENYPYFLGKLTDWIVTNGGNSGYTAIQWWETKAPTYNFADYDAFIIWLGTNAGFTDTLVADTTITEGQTYLDYANTNTGSLCKIIESIKAVNPNAKIFVGNCYATSGTVGSGSDLDTTNSVIEQIASRYNLPLIDNNNGIIYPTALYHTIYNSNLNVHFSKIGNLHLARHYLNNIISSIKENEVNYENLLI